MMTSRLPGQSSWPIETENYFFSLLPLAWNSLPKSVSLSAPPVGAVWHRVHGNFVCAVNAGEARTGFGLTRAMVLAAKIAAPAPTTKQRVAVPNTVEIHKFLLQAMRVSLPVTLRDDQSDFQILLTTGTEFKREFSRSPRGKYSSRIKKHT